MVANANSWISKFEICPYPNKVFDQRFQNALKVYFRMLFSESKNNFNSINNTKKGIQVLQGMKIGTSGLKMLKKYYFWPLSDSLFSRAENSQLLNMAK